MPETGQQSRHVHRLGGDRRPRVARLETESRTARDPAERRGEIEGVDVDASGPGRQASVGRDARRVQRPHLKVVRLDVRLEIGSVDRPADAPAQRDVASEPLGDRDDCGDAFDVELCIQLEIEHRIGKARHGAARSDRQAGAAGCDTLDPGVVIAGIDGRFQRFEGQRPGLLPQRSAPGHEFHTVAVGDRVANDGDGLNRQVGVDVELAVLVAHLAAVHLHGAKQQLDRLLAGGCWLRQVVGALGRDHVVDADALGAAVVDDVAPPEQRRGAEVDDDAIGHDERRQIRMDAAHFQCAKRQPHRGQVVVEVLEGHDHLRAAQPLERLGEHPPPG